MDWAHHPVWLDLQHHWWGFILTAPTFGTVGEDAVAFAFESEVPCVQHIVSDSENSEGGTARSLEYQVDPDWTDKCKGAAVLLHLICRNLAEKSISYGPNRETTGLGPLPVGVDVLAIKGCYEMEQEVLNIGARAQHGVLSLLGWLTWYISVEESWREVLSPEEIGYVNLLQLQSRPKRVYAEIYKVELLDGNLDTDLCDRPQECRYNPERKNGNASALPLPNDNAVGGMGGRRMELTLTSKRDRSPIALMGIIPMVPEVVKVLVAEVATTAEGMKPKRCIGKVELVLRHPCNHSANMLLDLPSQLSQHLVKDRTGSRRWLDWGSDAHLDL
ncbi:hypothetical protein C8R45DRAFT_1102418 [Mycena sanguinolenta]|nr:hypothetical protein C8R45DRAFT_1102418 [Mycena sanguinolenta]